MIFLFTDYGCFDHYVGLLKTAIWAHAPSSIVVDLLHQAPVFNIMASAHLLAAMSAQLPNACVCVAVVDPGVGSERGAVVMWADEKWYVGPDNGLFSVLAGRARKVELWRIDWRPENLSVSFHGRDLFAPVAAWIEKGAFPHDKLACVSHLQVGLDSGDLAEVIYIDHYGNLLTGLRAAQVPREITFLFGSHLIKYARVFSVAVHGHLFWYENSLGLVEFALNGSSAAQYLNARIGDQFEIHLAA